MNIEVTSLVTSNKGNKVFGQIVGNHFYSNFGGLLPPGEDFHQNVLCFTTKVAT